MGGERGEGVRREPEERRVSGGDGSSVTSGREGDARGVALLDGLESNCPSSVVGDSSGSEMGGTGGGVYAEVLAMETLRACG
jgi:hypothetical protein